ncbi:hypothetical protein OG874_13485 [Nocardia sp. NBC_00565]|uniref:hypothetical protein n=1 Tax=Nocardia sp. NBC_00565 TaxID=2975993 RepID=UPI002E803EFD|nr:hypothetical protein [Nocardia sp. NBC_00565]WUC06081.1 hypothetical protein OG874_13485 [Nocardia sp. NBC_00565]
MRWWKAVGLAGAAGVVATGVVIVRAERRRRAYTPDQVREQLHMRLAQATSAQAAIETAAPAPRDASGIRGRIRRLFRR